MLLTILINTGIVMLAVLLHYEVLNFLSRRLTRLRPRHRSLVLVGVIGALSAHVLEICLFGLGYYGLLQMEGFGQLQGNFDGSLWDCIYFSFSTFTTLGFGDIEPLGDIRLLTGLEGLTGLVLITWSASFMFIEIQRFWRD